MKIKLRTNFLDYYDHWFCGSWQNEDYILDRRTITEMSKIDQFQILKDCELNIPKVGYIKDLINDVEINNVVVYTDLFLHAGDGKSLCTKDFALKTFGENYFCSEYVNPPKRE